MGSLCRAKVTHFRGLSGNRTQSSSIPQTRATETLKDRFVFMSVAVLRNASLKVIEVGFEPTKSHALNVLALPICVLDHVAANAFRGKALAAVRMPFVEEHPRRLRVLEASIRSTKWRVRGSHPASRAYEAPMSTGPPASCKSRDRTERADLMKVSWTPVALAS